MVQTTMTASNSESHSTTSSAVSNDQVRQRSNPSSAPHPADSATTPNHDNASTSAIALFLSQFLACFIPTLAISLSVSLQSSLIYFSVRNIISIASSKTLLDLAAPGQSNSATFATFVVLSVFNTFVFLIGVGIASDNNRSALKGTMQMSGVYLGGWSAVLASGLVLIRGSELLGRYT